ncbi:MAG: RsmG family class I SAM-dependent methyltransferase [Deferrisomatales bacterium]|nr:RsmG family class I SAM-dependent methyltransferase [Deferrisomatales bacterium]
MTPGEWDRLLRPDLRAALPWERFETYARELERWNRSVRLVGPRDLPGIRLQIADAVLPFLLVPPRFPLLDIGSGAGLPALPIALAWPGAVVVCLEPLGKRASFLRHAVRVLGLGRVRVVQSRHEEALREQPELAGSFASVTARALAAPHSLLKSARPFLAPSGDVFLLLGSGPAEPPIGWSSVEDLEYPPPPGAGPRRLQVYRRID